jgi:hypothetical protein
MAHASRPAPRWRWRFEVQYPREVGIVNSRRAAEGPPGAGPAWILRIGGVAALLLAAGYVATIPLFAAVGAPPSGAQARLDYHASTTTAWWAIVALSVLTDLLFLPVAIALYTALRRSSEAAMLLASAFTLLFVVLDLAVTWPAYASLITLSQQYATATAVDQRALVVAAAGYPSAVLSSPLQSIDSILTLSIGILVAGLVMLRGAFGRAAGILGVTTGLVGIASVAQTALTGEVSPLAIATSLLTIAWLVLVGRGLLRSPRSLEGADLRAAG